MDPALIRKSLWVRVCVFLMVGVWPLLAGDRADFALINQPRNLTILDRFQQRLTKSQTAIFGSLAPFQILKLNETLGDQLTQAHRVAFGDDTYFLLLDEAGRLVGLKDDRDFQVLQNCEVLEDTIRIKQAQTISLRKNLLGPGDKITLKKDDVLFRKFAYKGDFYLCLTGPRKGSGWSPLKPANAWEQVKTDLVPRQAVLSAQERDRISGRMASANQAYRNYFEYFNRQTGEKRTSPEWNCQATADGFKCSWRGSSDDWQRLYKSTQVLVQDLENILLGKPFAVSCRNRTILIQPANN